MNTLNNALEVESIDSISESTQENRLLIDKMFVTWHSAVGSVCVQRRLENNQ